LDLGLIAGFGGPVIHEACPCQSVCDCKDQCTNECTNQCSCVTFVVAKLSVRYIGKKRLKKHVVGHLYGVPEHLHPNLLNNFINLCKNVYIHNEDETLMPEKSIMHEDEDN
jgi:hypothetical protein